jgi:hypothetical protein
LFDHEGVVLEDGPDNLHCRRGKKIVNGREGQTKKRVEINAQMLLRGIENTAKICNKCEGK